MNRLRGYSGFDLIPELRIPASAPARRGRDVDQDERRPGFVAAEQRQRRQRRVVVVVRQQRHQGAAAGRRDQHAEGDRRRAAGDLEELGALVGGCHQPESWR